MVIQRMQGFQAEEELTALGKHQVQSHHGTRRHEQAQPVLCRALHHALQKHGLTVGAGVAVHAGHRVERSFARNPRTVRPPEWQRAGQAFDLQPQHGEDRARRRREIERGVKPENLTAVLQSQLQEGLDVGLHTGQSHDSLDESAGLGQQVLPLDVGRKFVCEGIRALPALQGHGPGLSGRVRIGHESNRGSGRSTQRTGLHDAHPVRMRERKAQVPRDAAGLARGHGHTPFEAQRLSGRSAGLDLDVALAGIEPRRDLEPAGSLQAVPVRDPGRRQRTYVVKDPLPGRLHLHGLLQPVEDTHVIHQRRMGTARCGRAQPDGKERKEGNDSGPGHESEHGFHPSVGSSSGKRFLATARSCSRDGRYGSRYLDRYTARASPTAHSGQLSARTALPAVL